MGGSVVVALVRAASEVAAATPKGLCRCVNLPWRRKVVPSNRWCYRSTGVMM
jgi:hypothetical protein